MAALVIPRCDRLLKPNYIEWVVIIIAECNKTIQFCCSFQSNVIFGYHVVPTDCSLTAGNVRLSAIGAMCVNIVTSMAGIAFKLTSLDNDVESAVGFCTLK